MAERLSRLTEVETEAAQLRAEADKLRSETAMSGRLTDEMTARMDQVCHFDPMSRRLLFQCNGLISWWLEQMADQLRKARMFAASEEYYVDRRLVSNIVVSYFDGMKVLHFYPSEYVHSFTQCVARSRFEMETAGRKRRGLIAALQHPRDDR